MEEKRKKQPEKKIEIKVNAKGDNTPFKLNTSIRTKKTSDETSRKNAKIVNPDGDTKKLSVSNEQRPENKSVKSQVQTKPGAVQKEDAKPKVKDVQDSAKTLLNKRLLDLKRYREQYITRSQGQRGNRPQDTKKDGRASPKPQENIGTGGSTVKETIVRKSASPRIRTASPTKQIKKAKDDNQTDKETKEIRLEVTKCTQSQKKISRVVKTFVTEDGVVKTFKEVEFIEPKQLTPLEIKIPTEVNEKIIYQSIFDTNSKESVNKTCNDESVDNAASNIKKKRNINELKKKPRARVSPKNYIIVKNDKREPMHETASLVPTSINNLTKPYYDAWVDKTLTATSTYLPFNRKPWKDRQTKRFVNYLAPETPAKIPTNIDEFYTGRIKITQK